MLRRNILIFHAGALGDFVLTWPVAMALARIYPQNRVFYVTASEKGKLAERVLGVESKDVEAGWTHLFGDPARLPEPARRTLEGTRAVVNLVTPDNDPWVTNVRDASRGAEIITLKPRPAPNEAEGVHASRFIQAQLAPNRILHEAVGQMITSVNEKGAGTVRKAGPTPLLLLHPGSGSREKCWPIDRWTELAHRLRSAGHPTRFVLGEVERARFSPADVATLQRAADVKWLDRYTQLLDELATASAFIGNDSGPAHLAGAIGLPTVTLFGPTDPRTWSPMGPRVKIISAPQLAAIDAASIFGAAADFLREQPTTGSLARSDDDDY